MAFVLKQKEQALQMLALVVDFVVMISIFSCHSSYHLSKILQWLCGAGFSVFIFGQKFRNQHVMFICNTFK